MGGVPTEPIIALAAVAAIALGVVGFQAFRIRERMPAGPSLAEVAAARGLERVDARRYVGRIDDFEVVLEIHRSKSDGARVELQLSGGLPDRISLGPRTTTPVGPGAEQPTHDTRFDSAVWVRGETRQVLACLDLTSRQGLGLHLDPPWTLEGGVWRHTLWGPSAQDLEERIDQGLTLARLVRCGDEPELARLARATRDPVLAVRRHALRWLIAHEPEHTQTRSALEAALEDRHPEIQLEAATRLGHLETLARVAERAPAPLRTEALEELVRIAPGAELTTNALERALQLAAPEDRPLRRATLDLIYELRLDGFETTLIALLDEHDDELRVRVMEVLGEVGTLAAVPALLPFRDLLIGFSLKDAAKAAIFAIQARSGAPEHGALALTGSGGELALVERPNS